MRQNGNSILVVVFLVFALSSSTLAYPAPMINYQGQLTDNEGNPLDTTVSMTFSVYEEPGGIIPPIWTEAHPAVMVIEGLFNVVLGTYVPIDDSIFVGNEQYLRIAVGGDPQLEPETRLVSVPHAHRVGTIDGSDGGIVWDTIRVLGSSGIGGHLLVSRDIFDNGFIVDGNYNGTDNPKVTLDGSARDAVFDMSVSGDASIQLPTDAISDDEILNEPGITSKNNTSTVSLDLNPVKDLETITITIPTDGFIVLIGQCNFTFSGTTGPNGAVVQIDENAGGSVQRPYYAYILDHDYISTNNYYNSAFVQRVYNKSQGTYTFRLEASRVGIGNVTATDATLTAMFYPTSYGTVETISSEIHQKQDPEVSQHTVTELK